MKRIALLLFIFPLCLSLKAQSPKYNAAMESNVTILDTTRTYTSWQELANNFERIAEAEKNQWLPFYYSALCNVMTGYMLMNPGTGGGNSVQSDQIADKAEALLTKAEALSGENSEVFCIKKMISTLRMMADPQTRFQTDGVKATEALTKAKTLDPKNPRVYLLEGQDKFFTPEQFGGSKSEAKLLFEESVKLYETVKPKSSIDPRWGLGQVKYFLGQIK